jgi:two-component system, LuxR family, response regulator FixJ
MAMIQSDLASNQGTVFVVDDDDSSRLTLQFLLEAEGFEVQSYSGAEEVLSEVDLPNESCLVTDYNMPGMDGLDLVATLRTRGNSIPAILVTGDPNRAVRDRAAAAGVPVIEKCYSASSLAGQIKGLINPQFN